MRFFSGMMVIAFCFVFTFLFVSSILSKSCDDYKDKYYRHDTDTMVWFAEAWASAHDFEEGYFSIWCHVGSGDNDYKGGPYQGGFYMDAGSADVNNGDEEPTPYFSHSYINGGPIDNTPLCDVCTDGGSCCGSSGGSGSQ